MKNVYDLLFYKLYRLFKFTADEGWEDKKVMGFLTMLECAIVVELLVWYTVVTKHTFDINKYAFGIPVIVTIMTFNCYYFYYKNSWKEIVHKFEHDPIAKKSSTSWLTLLFVIGALGSVFLSFYVLSLQYPIT